MIVWVHLAASWLMGFVPVRVAHRAAAALTPLVLLFARQHLARARANMAQVLGPGAPERQVDRLTLAAFRNYARYMVDMAHLPHVDRGKLAANFELRGVQHLEEAFARGRGVVLVTGHVGNWDLGGAAIAARGKPISVLVETLRPPRWNERVQRIREHVGMRAIPVEAGVREMVATLRRKEGLAIVVDRPLDDESGVTVSFFGRTTRVPGGAATLALRTGAVVLPAALVRKPGENGFIAHVGEPMFHEAGRAGAQEVQLLTQRIMSWLEAIIRQYPDQWYMFRHMWPPAAAVPSSASLSPAAGATP